jgi:hypothetical protein
MEDTPQKTMSRTGLLKLGAVAAFVLGTGPASRALASDTTGKDAATPTPTIRHPVRGPRYLRFATYVPLVGSSFRIHRSQASALSVELVSAKALPSDVGESFSLIFRGHGNAKLQQETYTLEHARLGRFPLFLVPVGPARRGQDFQAIVNRIPSSLMPRV